VRMRMVLFLSLFRIMPMASPEKRSFSFFSVSSWSVRSCDCYTGGNLVAKASRACIYDATSSSKAVRPRNDCLFCFAFSNEASYGDSNFF